MKEKIKIPKEIAYLCREVASLRDIYQDNKNNLGLVEAIYCFWWIADKRVLFNKAKRKRPVGRPIKTRSHKTKKRLEIKRLMLEAKANKKKRK